MYGLNFNVLVIFFGFDFDVDLIFLKDCLVNFSFKKKFVLEFYWYVFINGIG